MKIALRFRKAARPRLIHKARSWRFDSNLIFSRTRPAEEAQLVRLRFSAVEAS